MAQESIVLNTGAKVPLLGIGTWQVDNPEECKASIRAALDAGYRHIDTAHAYKNEAFIGEVLQEYFKAGKLKREDLFVTTKLWLTFCEKDRVKLSLEESLKKLQLDYVDLFLIHFPLPLRETGKLDPYRNLYPIDETGKIAFNMDVKLEDTWRGMQECVKIGKTKSIGVSNFSIQQVERMIKIGGTKPSTNQVECHLFLQQPKLLDYLKKNGVTMTAYGPIGSPGRPSKKPGDPEPLTNQVAQELAAKYKKTVAQVLLRHLAQKGIIVIPKSSNPKRLKENIDIFDFKLTDQEMERLNKEDKNFRLFVLEVAKGHPEYQIE